MENVGLGYILIDVTSDCTVRGVFKSLLALRKYAMTRDHEYSVVKLCYTGQDNDFYNTYKVERVGTIEPPKWASVHGWEWISDTRGHCSYTILKNGAIKR